MGKQVQIYNGWRVGQDVFLKENRRPYIIVEIETNDHHPAKFLLDDGVSFKEVTENALSRDGFKPLQQIKVDASNGK
jgi:hypothetical protein